MFGQQAPDLSVQPAYRPLGEIVVPTGFAPVTYRAPDNSLALEELRQKRERKKEDDVAQGKMDSLVKIGATRSERIGDLQAWFAPKQSEYYSLSKTIEDYGGESAAPNKLVQQRRELVSEIQNMMAVEGQIDKAGADFANTKGMLAGSAGDWYSDFDFSTKNNPLGTFKNLPEWKRHIGEQKLVDDALDAVGKEVSVNSAVANSPLGGVTTTRIKNTTVAYDKTASVLFGYANGKRVAGHKLDIDDTVERTLAPAQNDYVSKTLPLIGINDELVGRIQDKLSALKDKDGNPLYAGMGWAEISSVLNSLEQKNNQKFIDLNGAVSAVAQEAINASLTKTGNAEQDKVNDNLADLLTSDVSGGAFRVYDMNNPDDRTMLWAQNRAKDLQKSVVERTETWKNRAAGSGSGGNTVPGQINAGMVDTVTIKAELDTEGNETKAAVTEPMYREIIPYVTTKGKAPFIPTLSLPKGIDVEDKGKQDKTEASVNIPNATLTTLKAEYWDKNGKKTSGDTDPNTVKGTLSYGYSQSATDEAGKLNLNLGTITIGKSKKSPAAVFYVPAHPKGYKQTIAGNELLRELNAGFMESPVIYFNGWTAEQDKGVPKPEPVIVKTEEDAAKNKAQPEEKEKGMVGKVWDAVKGWVTPGGGSTGTSNENDDLLEPTTKRTYSKP